MYESLAMRMMSSTAMVWEWAVVRLAMRPTFGYSPMDFANSLSHLRHWCRLTEMIRMRETFLDASSIWFWWRGFYTNSLSRVSVYLLNFFILRLLNIFFRSLDIYPINYYIIWTWADICTYEHTLRGTVVCAKLFMYGIFLRGKSQCIAVIKSNFY